MKNMLSLLMGALLLGSISMGTISAGAENKHVPLVK